MRYPTGRMGVLCCAVALVAAGCGGGSSSGSAESAPAPMEPQNVPPSVSSVADQSIDQDGLAGPLSVTVTDPETDASDLDLSVTSADSDLLPAEGIHVIGEGGHRMLTLIPGPGQSGVTEVMLTVVDGEGARASSRFMLVVNPLLRAEFSSWMRHTVLARDEFDTPVGEEPVADGSLGDVENILRIRFSDGSAGNPEAYDDLLSTAGT